jgi:hypothetical protein
MNAIKQFNRFSYNKIKSKLNNIIIICLIGLITYENMQQEKE